MSTTTRLMEKLLVFQERQAVALERIAEAFTVSAPIAAPNQQHPADPQRCPDCGMRFIHKPDCPRA